MALLVRRVRVDDVWPTRPHDPAPIVDIRIEGDRITEIGPNVTARAGDEELDGVAGTVIPGLHDHHVHLFAWAAAASSVAVGPDDVADEAALGERLSRAPGPPGSWIRATGYHESVAGLPDRAALDRLVPDRPIRIQHRGGSLWLLNSRALDALGLEDGAATGQATGGFEVRDGTEEEMAPSIERDGAGRPTGRIWRADRWLRERLSSGHDGGPDLGDLSRRAAAFGVTGFTDATFGVDEATMTSLVAARAEGTLLQRLHVLSPLPDPTTTRHDPPHSSPLGPDRGVTMGAVKVLLDDDRIPAFDDLANTIRRAHGLGTPVAVHCVTRTQAALTVAVLAEAGSVAGDRMEHGAVLGADLLAALRDLGVTVVSQPGFLYARGDRYLADVDPNDLDDLWRLGSLLDAGIEVALSTDAPFGPDNPWTAVRTASERRTRTGQVLSSAERIPPARALSLFLGEPTRPTRRRRVAPQSESDLVVLEGGLDEALVAPSPVVMATIVQGRVVHRADRR